MPKDLLIVDPSPPQPPILAMDGMLSSVELEDCILDVDGRVSPANRQMASNMSSINHFGDVISSPQQAGANRTAKALSIWRWSDEMKSDLEMQIALDRAGRSFAGTVYYLIRA